MDGYFWIRIKNCLRCVFTGSCSSGSLGFIGTDLRERYAMWKNVDLEAWYRSRFIGFMDLSPRSDTEFGLNSCLAESIDQANWMCHFSHGWNEKRMRWWLVVRYLCKQFIPEILSIFISACSLRKYSYIRIFISVTNKANAT